MALFVRRGALVGRLLGISFGGGVGLGYGSKVMGYGFGWL